MVTGASVQDQLNRRVYFSPTVLRHYRSEVLTPAEIACLLRYQPALSGKRVLDIGVGSGRTTRYLEPLAGRYEAIDYSPVMVACMRERMPGVRVHEADWRALDGLAAESFDFVLATNNVIDAFGHEDRLRALRETARVLSPFGMVAFSSHNLRYRDAFGRPRMQWSLNPATALRRAAAFGQGWANYFRVARYRKVTAEYALLNDVGHNFACLHYYVSHRTMRSQTASVGLQLIDAIDDQGMSRREEEDDSHSPHLLYVARKRS